MTGASIDLDILKDIPGYKGILKAVLRYQIQQLVEQLCKHGGEESVVLSANVTEGTLSHLGTEAGKGFLIDNNEVKRQYLGYCLKNYQKRKSEFMSPSVSNEEIQPAKFAFSKRDSVVGYPVHKKPYFRAQRRNTRLRSGGKQFSTFYSKTGLNRPTLQKIATQGAYRVIEEDASQNQSQLSRQIDSTKQHEMLNQQYKGQRLFGGGQRSEIALKAEYQTDEGNSSEGQNEREVTVKIEPSQEVDETGSMNSTKMSEDIQTLEGVRLGHHFSPNVSMETEDSFSEGNQSFEYVLDQENSEGAISPWKPDETEKLSQFTSKRKQALPTRINKSTEQIKDKSEVFGQLSQPKGSTWTQEQLFNLSADNTSYMEGGADMNWAEESHQTGGIKSYMKTPQIDGLFVSRGEGRYEKLIKCEDCGKVCRTSNMARHKKRYCTTLSSSGRTRKNYAQAIKEISFDGSKLDIYVDNPENELHPNQKSGTLRSILPKQKDNLVIRNTDASEINLGNQSDDFVHRRNDFGAHSLKSESSYDGDCREESMNIRVKQEPENHSDGI